MPAFAMLMLALFLILLFVNGVVAPAYVKFDDIEGEAEDDGVSDENGEFWFEDLHPGFHGENLPKKGCARGKESGEKGGTEDINIGIGELQECTLSKSIDSILSPLFVKSLRDGTPVADCNLCFSTMDLRGFPLSSCEILIFMEDCTVTKYKVFSSTGGDAGEDILTENVSLNFGAVNFTFSDAAGSPETVEWDISPPGCRRL